MAENKKSFVAYCEWKETLDELSDEEAGKLIKHIFAYVNDENPVAEDKIVSMCFIPIRQTLKRDLKKYETYVDKQKANGKKGGRPKKEETQITQAFLEKPKKADSVSVNVSVNDINNIYNRFVDEVKSGGFDSRIESMYMRLKIKQGSLTPLLIDFKHHLIEEDREHKTTNDLFLNFKNWLNVQDRIKKLDKYRN
jgi:hypothetical protein